MTAATATRTETYNGWTNYETWNVALWIQNDEFLYNTAKACVTYCAENETPYEKFIRCMLNCDYNITPDGVKWDSAKINDISINEMMEDL